MGNSQAQRVVIFVGAILMGMIFYNGYRCAGAGSTSAKLQCGGSTFSRAWVAGVLMLGLAFAADWAPRLVIPFSVAILVGFTYKNPGLLRSFISEPTKQATTQNPTRIDQRRKRALAGLPD